jgi:hypothetical protein
MARRDQLAGDFEIVGLECGDELAYPFVFGDDVAQASPQWFVEAFEPIERDLLRICCIELSEASLQLPTPIRASAVFKLAVNAGVRG